MARARSLIELAEYVGAKSMPVPWSGCHIWLGGLDKDGYGQAHMNNRNIRAHRLSFLLANGSIPNGAVIMHTCDTPSCVNPDHLRAGSNQDNFADMIQKNRHRVISGEMHYMHKNPAARSGENCPSSKLTPQALTEIRELLNAGVTQSKIAKLHGVSRTCISAISTGRNWKHNQEKH